MMGGVYDSDNKESLNRAQMGADIIFMFSNADVSVRSEFARPATLIELVNKMSSLPQSVLSKMLRVYNLRYSSPILTTSATVDDFPFYVDDSR
jgi:hypothetical protein